MVSLSPRHVVWRAGLDILRGIFDESLKLKGFKAIAEGKKWPI
jgi:hypothetical protein